MKQFHHTLRYLWLLFPKTFRDSSLLQCLRTHGKRLLSSHNDVYTRQYFQKSIEPTAAKAAPLIAESIKKHFAPNRVVDVGCGTGALLASLTELGCSCLGLEYADAGLNMCRARGLNVQKFDIRFDSLDLPLEEFDVAISLEVAEHLPEKYVDRYVDLLTKLSHNIVFTAAIPGQGGTDHVNEQPHDYWIQQFSKRGFVLDRPISEKWEATWRDAEIAYWYYQNIMVFGSTLDPE